MTMGKAEQVKKIKDAWDNMNEARIFILENVPDNTPNKELLMSRMKNSGFELIKVASNII